MCDGGTDYNAGGPSIGIGRGWIGGIQRALMDEKLMKEIGAPEGYIIVAPLIFGYLF